LSEASFLDHAASMLWEYWQYLTTSCPPYLRKMGYLEEMISIKSRAARLQNEWKEHLQKTKGAILRGAQKCEKRDKIVLCGSGWLLDIPLAELSKAFQKVLLVDIIHPRAVQKQIKAYSNVELHCWDCSGIASLMDDWISRMQAGEKFQLPSPAIQMAESFKNADFVCSVNLLSQLPIVPTEYLRSRISMNEEQGRELKRLIQGFHLNWIKIFPRWLVISDTESKTYDRLGKMVDRIELFEVSGDMKIQEEWEWNLAPLGEAHPAQRTIRRVVVCRND
jgi:hypothetical protein